MIFFNKYKVIIILFSIIFTVVIFFLITITTTDTNQEIQEKLFPMLEVSDELSGTVIFKQKIYRGYQTRVVLNNGVAYCIENSGNYSLGQNSLLCDFLQEKDSLFKKEGNDSINIYRKGEKFLFVLADSIE